MSELKHNLVVRGWEIGLLDHPEVFMGDWSATENSNGEYLLWDSLKLHLLAYVTIRHDEQVQVTGAVPLAANVNVKKKQVELELIKPENSLVWLRGTTNVLEGCYREATGTNGPGYDAADGPVVGRIGP